MDVDGPTAKPASNGEAPSGDREVDVGEEEDTLAGVLRSFVDGVWCYPDEPEPLLRRLRAASCEAAPRLRGASRNSARDLLEWTRRGSGLCAILVISVGTITLIALTGLLIFMFFLLVATANAIIVSVLMSLAAAGGFLAIFFACLVAVYIGAVSVASRSSARRLPLEWGSGEGFNRGQPLPLQICREVASKAVSVAIFAISATVISAVVGVMIATGWVGFFWMIWFAARKSMDLTKHSIGVTSSAIQSYSASRHVNQKPVE